HTLQHRVTSPSVTLPRRQHAPGQYGLKPPLTGALRLAELLIALAKGDAVLDALGRGEEAQVLRWSATSAG
ncbi:hypothetical protein, partial [Muricoccus pecuniae]